MLIRSTNFYFCRKSCKRAKSDHTVIGKPKCGQLSLSERELFERSNVSLLEQCEVSSYPQILLLQSERLFHGELQSRLVKWNNSCIKLSSDTGSVGYGLLQDIFVVTQAGAVCCYASVAILVRATVQLYSDPVTNRKLHDHLIAFLPPRLVMCTVLVLLLETTHCSL